MDNYLVLVKSQNQVGNQGFLKQDVPALAINTAILLLRHCNSAHIPALLSRGMHMQHSCIENIQVILGKSFKIQDSILMRLPPYLEPSLINRKLGDTLFPSFQVWRCPEVYKRTPYVHLGLYFYGTNIQCLLCANLVLALWILTHLILMMSL